MADAADVELKYRRARGECSIPLGACDGFSEQIKRFNRAKPLQTPEPSKASQLPFIRIMRCGMRAEMAACGGGGAYATE